MSKRPLAHVTLFALCPPPTASRLCSALLAFLAASTAFAAEPVGAVVAVQGLAVLEHIGGARDIADAGMRVYLDDKAGTSENARLELRLGAGTRIKLGANTVLKIDRFVAKIDAHMELDEGPVVIERDKKAEKKFEVKTPFGLLAARGTIFFAGPSKDRFSVFVKEGAVDVTTGQDTVHLTAGDGTDFSLPGDPPSPIKKWGAERIKEAFDSVR